MGLSRQALWNLLEDAGPVAIPLLMAAYEHEELWAWKETDNSPRGLSFPVRLFPGDDPNACGRFAVYNLLKPPSEKPLEPRVRSWFDYGLDLEHQWVRRFASYGTLLSANVTAADDAQTQFRDDEHWMSGYVDAIILPRGWTKSFCVEIKTTSDAKVTEMLAGGRPPFSHAKYMRQLQTYIGMAQELPFEPTVNICDESGAIVPLGLPCPQHHQHCAFTSTRILPPDEGEVVYSSRDEPLKTVSFKASYDPNFLRVGREKLARWRDDFLADRIPPHPHQGKAKMWSADPCSFCDLKKSVCKPDYSAKIERLSESNIGEFARTIWPDWNYGERRRAMLSRWGVEDPLLAVT